MNGFGHGLAALADRMSPGLWLLAVVSALLVGMAKNGVPGLGILVVPAMAMIFPARESVGALLPLLIMGDVLAVRRFRAHADLSVLRRLLPWTLAGIGGGAVVMGMMTAGAIRPLLGMLVLVLVGVEVARRSGRLAGLTQRRGAAPALGLLTGVATTVGNAAGPLMNLYLLSRGFDRHRFIGTAAWFFLLVNLVKVPVYAGLELFTAETLLFDMLLAPLVVLGARIGRAVLAGISDRVFTLLVLALSAAAAIRLLVP
jgi:uncharacterized membrane protein YfcA